MERESQARENDTFAYLGQVNSLLPKVAENVSAAVRLADGSNPKGSAVLEMLFVGVGATSVVFNLIALVVFLSHKVMRSQKHIKLLISQSVIDFLTGSILVIHTISLRFRPSHFEGALGEFLCKYWYTGIVIYMPHFISTCNLVAHSIMQYLAVVHPIIFKVHFRLTTAYVVIAMSYIPGMVIFIPTAEATSRIRNGMVSCFTF